MKRTKNASARTITIAGHTLKTGLSGNVALACTTWNSLTGAKDLLSLTDNTPAAWLNDNLCGQCVHRLFDVVNGFCSTTLDYKEREE